MGERLSAVFYDVDGTIYDHETKTVPRMAQEALRRLTVPAMPVTGRSYPLMRRLEKHGLELTGLGSLDSGATIVDFDKKQVVWEKWLQPDTVLEVLRKIGRRTVDISVSTLEDRVNFKPNEIDSRFSYKQKSPSVFAIYDLVQKEYFAETLGEIEGIKTRFMQYNTSTEQGCLQVTYEGIDKEPGTVMLVDMMGLYNERVAGIGDDIEGDGPLFGAIEKMKNPGITIAMGNADPLLKARADMTVASVSDTPDGFTDAMQKLELVKLGQP